MCSDYETWGLLIHCKKKPIEEVSRECVYMLLSGFPLHGKPSAPKSQGDLWPWLTHLVVPRRVWTRPSWSNRGQGTDRWSSGSGCGPCWLQLSAGRRAWCSPPWHWEGAGPTYPVLDCRYLAEQYNHLHLLKISRAKCYLYLVYRIESFWTELILSTKWTFIWQNSILSTKLNFVRARINFVYKFGPDNIYFFQTKMTFVDKLTLTDCR